LLFVGETLFVLRRCSGFPELCRRLRKQKGEKFRNTFTEVLAARLFFDGGYDISARREISVKTEDCEFTTIRDGERVNVEVTTLAEKEFNPKTIPKSLHKKRKQLPDTAPGVIVVCLPLCWGVTLNMASDAYLGDASRQLFEETNRPSIVNAVVFFGERLAGSPGPGYAGAYAIISKVFENPSATIKILNMDFLNKSTASKDPLLKQLASGQLSRSQWSRPSAKIEGWPKTASFIVGLIIFCQPDLLSCDDDELLD
jgi:hypothetical protein